MSFEDIKDQVVVNCHRYLYQLLRTYLHLYGNMEHNSPLLGFREKFLTGYSTPGTLGKEVKCNILADDGWIQRSHPTRFNKTKLMHLVQAMFHSKVQYLTISSKYNYPTAVTKFGMTQLRKLVSHFVFFIVRLGRTPLNPPLYHIF